MPFSRRGKFLVSFHTFYVALNYQLLRWRKIAKLNTAVTFTAAMEGFFFGGLITLIDQAAGVGDKVSLVILFATYFLVGFCLYRTIRQEKRVVEAATKIKQMSAWARVAIWSTYIVHLLAIVAIWANVASRAGT